MSNLRKLKIGDEDQLKPLFKILTGKEITIDTGSLVVDPNSICLILENTENDIIGFGALIIHKVPTKGEVARIEDVVIAENYQGKGFGKQIMEELINIAKEKNISQINLTSSPMRTAARKLYEKLGFIKGDTDVFYLKL